MMKLREDGVEIYEKMTKLSELKRNKADYLKLLIQLTLNVMTFPPVRLCLIYVFCQYSLATILALYHLLSRFDKESLLKHGSFCGIQIFVLINMGSIVFMTDDFHEFLKAYEKIKLPLELLNQKNLTWIKNISIIIKIICCVNMVFALIAAIGFIAAPEYFSERTYLCVWIRQTFPKYSNIMLSVVYWTSLPVALVLAGSSLSWAYASVNAIFQLHIMHEMIGTISKTTIPRNMRRHSKLYQNIVREKMIMCILVYELFCRFHVTSCDMLDVPLLAVSLGSLILGASLMIEFLSNQTQDLQDQYAIYVGIFCFVMAGVISANIYLIIGQILKDESENCNYHLSQVPWYDMNEKNKKIYSIFLYRTNRSLAIGNSLVQVDYVLLVKIAKSLYSMAAVLAQFVTSNAPTDMS